MRVLLVNAGGADRTYGGAERYVDDLAAGLEGRGHEVELLSAFPTPSAGRRVTVALHGSDWRTSRVRRLRNHGGDWLAAPHPGVARALRRLQPEVLHTNNLPGLNTSVWQQAREAGVPVVHTLHDYHLLCPRTSLTRRDGGPCDPHPLLCGLRSRRLGRWAWGVEVVIGVTQYVLDRHQGFFPTTTERMVIYHPMRPRAGVTPPVSGTRPRVIGFLGSLTRSKGIELLLQAAPALVRDGWEVRVAGDGPLRAQVEAAPQAHYEGWKGEHELTGFLTRCDVGVVPSLWEEPGVPFTLFEWLEARRPVLCTRRGGISEWSDRPGLLPFAPSADGLREAGRRLLDGRCWTELVAGVPVVEDDRDVQRWLDQHEAAYERASARIRLGTAA